ncbi:DUF4118 domain-containing protein [Pokkaliibacter sp. CJK22405]|uniref:DUF4118 domain-containing protein n=1 Tax=Pokkaliibacter sp. CJK22405 TaxID=3384615 RepID=UPI00398484ED
MTTPSSPRADALLTRLKREGPGRLTVFLGAAPGVGKTCAMLNAAYQKLQEGVALRIGVVETHGRAETAQLAERLPSQPRLHHNYQGIDVEEMDLAALLAEPPALVLVDELAHSNLIAGRHSKRYQDVEELLAAGIDVMTTVNIQHLASLNDTVASITGVRVRETVPDRLLEQAREIVLVDLPARELISRLRAGKVYLPEQARAAIEAFFTLPNLTALRELALRTVAAHVDAQVRENWQVEGAAPGQDGQARLLVCIDADDEAERLIRHAKQRAEWRQMPWMVVHVQRQNAMSAQRLDRLQRAFMLAESLGGSCHSLSGTSIVDEVLAFARRHHVTDILLGRSPASRHWYRLRTLLRPSLGQSIARKADDLHLMLLSRPAHARQAIMPTPRTMPRWGDHLKASGIMLTSLAMAFAAAQVLALSNVLMILLVGVLVASIMTRVGPALSSALIGFLGFNFLFTEPRFTLAIHHKEDVLTVCFFLILSSVTGSLAGRLRQQLQAQRQAQEATDVLLHFSRQLVTAADEKSIRQLGERFIAQWLTRDVTILAALPEMDYSLDARAIAAAQWAWQQQQAAGAGTDTLNSSEWYWLPLISGPECLGLLGIRMPIWQPEHKTLLNALAQQLVQALARAKLARDLEQSRIQGETEQLKSALLSSVSHDLRTPLASMIGAVSSLIHYEDKLNAEDRRSLLDTTLEEAERLNRYIQNLLDMTRLGYGRLKLQRDWVSLEDIFSSALQRLHSVLAHCKVRLHLAYDIPLLYVHAALIEQALINILENAARFSPDSAPLLIEARMEGTQLRLSITDQGPGIDEEERARVFDMFYSVQKGDCKGGGTGLGLAICQGMIGAHGGNVVALPNPQGQGTCMQITLPLDKQPPLPDDEDS